MDYILAVQAPVFSLSHERFATESAFARHLIEIRKRLASKFKRLVLVAPTYSSEDFYQNERNLEVIDSERDGIYLVNTHSSSDSTLKFWTIRLPSLWRTIWTIAKTSGIIHSGMAEDIKRPMMAIVNLIAWLQNRPLVFIVDIDYRRDAKRYRETGLWSTNRYLVNKIVLGPLKYCQVWFAARTAHLVLLKARSMVSDFGDNRTNVRFFLDAAHGVDDVLSDVEMTDRVSRVLQSGHALHLIYFGRLVPYKGVNCTVQAVRIAREAGEDMRLTIIGDGESAGDLERLIIQYHLQDVVTILPAVKYGSPLFVLLQDADLAVATPLGEDTPRSALDAMARGLPIVAFDLEYYQTLAEESGAVALAAWPDPQGIADRLIELSRNRPALAGMSQNAVRYARKNTQDIWLQHRLDWTFEAFDDPNATRKALRSPTVIDPGRDRS